MDEVDSSMSESIAFISRDITATPGPTLSTIISTLDINVLSRRKKLFMLAPSVVLALIMSLYNLLLFSRKHYNVGLPLFAAFIYDLTHFLMASLLISITERKEGPGLLRALTSCPMHQFYKFMLPCGVAAGLNVALSNSSLQFVSLSFYTMVKSSSLLFLLLFAILFKIEKPTLQLLSITVIVGVGLTLTVYNPSSFDGLGFTLVFCSAILSGFRWSLTQVIIQNSSLKDLDEENKIDGKGPLRTILHLSPVIIFTVLLLSLILEGPKAIWNSRFFANWHDALVGTLLCIFGGIQSFFIILLDYACVKETSVLTLSIISVIKEILIIGISVAVLGEKIQPINFFGASVSVLGVVLYGAYKIGYSKEHYMLEEEGDRLRRQLLEDSAMQHLYVAAPGTPLNFDSFCTASLLPPIQSAQMTDSPLACLRKSHSCLDFRVGHDHNNAGNFDIINGIDNIRLDGSLIRMPFRLKRSVTMSTDTTDNS